MVYGGSNGRGGSKRGAGKNSSGKRGCSTAKTKTRSGAAGRNSRKKTSNASPTIPKQTRDGEPVLRIWTDGSALRNPNGCIGWGWCDETGRHDNGGSRRGTNQIAELTAVLQALLAHPVGALGIITDSEYTLKCCTRWYKNWRRNGWVTSGANPRPVMNRPLIETIGNILDNRPDPVFFEWTRGHVGTKGNETADRLAHGYAMECASGAKPERLPLASILSIESNNNVPERDPNDSYTYDYGHPRSLKQPKNKKPWHPHKPRTR